MKKIRSSVFETNSSSTHSVTILSKEKFEDWKSGEIYKQQYGGVFYTKDEFEQLVKDAADANSVSVEEVMDDIDDYELPQTYEKYREDDYLEVDVTNHKTESGEEIVVVCRYGRNG